MGREETRWDESETQLSTASVGQADAAAEVPGLTILAHPDPRRVGERLALPALAAGGEIRLSRLEPVFRAPDRPDDPPRPLEERHLSRKPIKLTGVSEKGSVAIDVSATRTPVVADGQKLEGRRVFSGAELERGVVLLLGRRIVLLLHRIPAGSQEPLPGFGLIGESGAMMRLRQEIRRLAPLDVPVLLRGETGTGKELVARALHDAGPRRDGPFVAVNMGVLNPSLAAAELFGAVRGAYTGADRKKDGFFESARHGTLFLDEIGETPLEVQVMLLRALESCEVQPVGSTEALEIDVRVIAATDVRLEEAIAAGRFRAPLYHRLAGYAVYLPALRERRDDVGRLLYHVLAEEVSKFGTMKFGTMKFGTMKFGTMKFGTMKFGTMKFGTMKFGTMKFGTIASGHELHWLPEIVARLSLHDWPGNVRELKNVTRRLAIAGRDADIEKLLESMLSDASPPQASSGTTAAAPHGGLRRASDIRDEELIEALSAHRWRVQDSADALGISRAALYKLMERSALVRKASELSREEIVACQERCGGSVDAMVDALRVYYSVAVEKSFMSNKDEIKAKLDLEYKAALVKAGAEAEAEWSKVGKKWTENRVVHVETKGGDSSLLDAVSPGFGDNHSGAFKSWREQAERNPAAVDFELTPMSELFSGEKADAMKQAFEEYAKNRVYVESKSDGSTIVVAGKVEKPAEPAEDHGSGFQVAVLDRKTLESVENSYAMFAWGSQYWSKWQQVYEKLGGILRKYEDDSRYLVIIAARGMLQNWVPPESVYQQLLALGASTNLRGWLDFIGESGSPYPLALNYILVGVPGRGIGSGAEAISRGDSVVWFHEYNHKWWWTGAKAPMTTLTVSLRPLQVQAGDGLLEPVLLSLGGTPAPQPLAEAA